MPTPSEWGKICRRALGDQLKPKWGSYSLTGRKLLFDGKVVFALYSNFHSEISQWFYGISKTEWNDWQNDYLAILMKELNEVNYVLLDQTESVTLLSKCGQDSRGEKKVNIRRPTGAGAIYVVEWEEFHISRRISSLQLPNIEDQ